MDTKFKVGDRVRNRDTGSLGEITELKDDGKYYVRFPYPSGICCENGETLELISPPDTLTIGNKVYRKLKSLSPERVYAGNDTSACKEWREEFAGYAHLWGFYFDPTLPAFLASIDYHPKWLPWLISHGYISEEEKKEKKVVVIENVGWNPHYKDPHRMLPFVHDGGKIYVEHEDPFKQFANKPPMRITAEWEE